MLKIIYDYKTKKAQVISDEKTSWKKKTLKKDTTLKVGDKEIKIIW